MNEQPLTLLELIAIVEKTLGVILNYVDRMKTEEKCGHNLSLTCINLQKNVELCIERTRNEARFILDFTNMSKRYWIELSDLNKSSQKFNNRLNNNNASHFYTKDPNSAFNTIRSSIVTIPILNVNESIVSIPKTYHYMEIIEKMDSSSSSSSPFQSHTTLINNLLQYKTIVSSNKQNRELMSNFMDDLNNIETFSGLNSSLYEIILKCIGRVEDILLIQLESSGLEEKVIQRNVNEMKSNCSALSESIKKVIDIINQQQFNSKDYLLNTILYWKELNELQQTITVKMGQLCTQPAQQQQQQHSRESKSKLATFF